MSTRAATYFWPDSAFTCFSIRGRSDCDSQNSKAVKAWLTEEYPNIVNKAKKERAEIHWGDETGLCNDSYHGRRYAPCGETPAIKVHHRCKRVNLISTVTNQGKVRFMVYPDKMNSQTLIKFNDPAHQGFR